ncbi:hypothetical protein V8C34DRAFT_273097 [Trichoderma compactum]
MHVGYLVFGFLFLFSLIFMDWPIQGSPSKVKDPASQFLHQLAWDTWQTPSQCFQSPSCGPSSETPSLFFFLPNPIPLSHL